MKVTEILHEQHNQVRALFRRITAPNEVKDRPQLVDRLIGELHIHTRLEEEIFYPALREHTKRGEDAVLESIEEHDIVDFLMAQLSAMDFQSERFLARVRVLQSLVEEHVSEEDVRGRRVCLRALRRHSDACPDYGLATIEDPAVIRRILTHLGISLDSGDPLPDRGPQ